ncbi:hypothetical protein H2248_010284 [Termitomyces sp. 'cryptogamus']|nr:hypothetical protein H2248_010284 [Termitomyces sp. 'cryptogamus']
MPALSPDNILRTPRPFIHACIYAHINCRLPETKRQGAEYTFKFGDDEEEGKPDGDFVPCSVDFGLSWGSGVHESGGRGDGGC